MAYSLLGPVVTLEAAADLSASQGCAVVVDTNGRAALPAAGAVPFGILITNDASALKRSAAIQVAGIAEVKLGGTVAKGDKVKVDTSGRAVVAVATDKAFGICLEGGTINQMGTIFLQHQVV